MNEGDRAPYLEVMRQHVVGMFVVSWLAACSESPGVAELTYGTEPRTVSVTAPGAEPRRALAYTSRSGTRTARIVFESGTERDGAVSDDGLGFTAKLDWTRASSDPTRVVYSFRARDAVGNRRIDMSDDERQIVETIMKGFGSVAGQVRVGRTGDVALAQTAGMNTMPSWLGILHTTIVPLPSTPVGIGARWHTEQELTVDTTTIVDARDYELLAIDGNTLRVRVVGHAKTKGDADGVMTIDTTGEVDIALDDALPRSATLLSSQQVRFAAVPDDAGSPHLVRLSIER